jgi:hypothetical protein
VHDKDDGKEATEYMMMKMGGNRKDTNERNGRVRNK